MADPERRLWEGRNFKEVPRLLKSNRISLAHGLTSNKDQTLKKVALFSCYIEFVDFAPFSDALGTWPSLAPLGQPLNVIAPRPRLIRICM